MEKLYKAEMESLRNSSGGELLEALQERMLRRPKVKTSNISARLNPNFDPKVLTQSSSANKQFTANAMHENHPDIPSLAATPLILPTNLKEMPLVDRQEILASFKISMLNITLKFIKDPTRLVLPYPEMSLPQAQFLYNLIETTKGKDGNLGLGFKSLYASLYDTMNEFKENYEFQISFASTSNVLTTRLVYKKTPKKKQVALQNNSDNGTSKDLNSSTCNSASFIYSKCSTKLTKAQREPLSKENIVKKMHETFIRNILEKFFNFIEDKFMASLEIKNVSVAETRFIECLTSTWSTSSTSPRSEEFYKLFSAECGVLLKRVHRALRRSDWTLRIDVGKLSRRTETRLITFYKTPCYNEAQNHDTTITEDMGKASKLHIPIRSFCKSNDDMIENDGLRNKETYNLEELEISQSKAKESRPALSENKGLRTTSDGEECKPNNKEKSVASKEHGDHNRSLISDSNNQRLAGAGDGAATAPPPSRKGRLLKALATPLEGGWAERMMRNMGWEGGALGARGEGIVEPIMPAIHLTPGAGLGHVKQSEPSMPVVSFRLKLLDSLLTLLRSSSTETTVSFTKPVPKKYYKFFEPAVRDFNNRIKINWIGPEKELLEKINEEMIRDERIKIQLKITSDLKEKMKLNSVHLKKIVDSNAIQPSSTEKINAKSIPDDVTDHKDVTTASDVRTVIDVTNDIEKSCPTRKSAENLAYKIKFLENIKEFLVDENRTAEYKFDCVMNKKRRHYLQAIVANMNRGGLIRRGSDLENELLRYIAKVANEWFVTIDFSTQSFKLNKKLLAMYPPPKPTDLKNTVVYVNNIAMSAEKYDELIKSKDDKITNDDAPKNDDCGNDHCHKNNDDGKIVDDVADNVCEIEGDGTDNDYKNDDDGIITDDASKIDDCGFDNRHKNDDNGKITDVATDIPKIDDCGAHRHENINVNQDDTTYRGDNINIASNFKTILVSDRKGIPDQKSLDDDTTIETDMDLGSTFESSIISIPILENDVAKDGCDTNKNDDVSMIKACDDESKLILPDSDESFTTDETDRDLESDLESSKAGVSHDVSNDKNDSFKKNRHNENVDHDIEIMVQKNMKLRSFVDEAAAFDNNLKLANTDDSLSNDTANKSDMDLESDFGTSNTNISLDVIDPVITNIFEGQCKDDDSTKFSFSDTEYDNFKLNLHSEVNNNLNKVKDSNQAKQNTSPYKRNSSPTGEKYPKECEFVKYVRIISKDQKEIGIESVRIIQKLILEVIDEKVFLPLLKCHGIQDGGLIYSCHNEYSYDWLKIVMNIVSGVVMTDLNFSGNMFELSFKITSFIEEDASTIFNRLQMYNPGLSTEIWTVLEQQRNNNFVQFHVKVDESSFGFIRENGFSLYVGIDKAQFSILWN